MMQLLLAAALAVAPPAASPSAGSQSLNPNDRAQLQQNLDRGLRLYRYDQSAWHVTDAALATMSEETKKLVRGYITTPVPNGLKTTFFGERDGNYFALYSAVWTGTTISDPQVFTPSRHIPVSDAERRLILARKAALENATTLRMCSPAPPNVITVPGASDDLIHVYVLTPQTKANSYPFGGHNRIDVKDGKVVASRSFTNSCLELRRPEASGGAAPAALAVTHLLDPVPTEIHVFNVLAIGLPVYVATSDGIYAVEASGGQPRARLVSNEND